MTIAKYIVLTENKKEVRFFACGIVNEDKTFTGIIYDYVGGGNYQEALVFEDQWIPTAEEWDTQVEIFNSLSPVDLETIEFSYTEDLLYYDTNENVQNYCVFPEALDMFNENGVLIDNMSLVVPYGLGNTTFPDGYEIDEALSYDVVTCETENDFLSENKNLKDSFSSCDDALKCAEEIAVKNYLVAVQIEGYTLKSFKSDSSKNKELLEIRYILNSGLITAVKPEGFDEMSSKEREEWACDILSEKTDFELVKGTYTLEDDKNDAGSSLQDINKVYDETPYVEAIASGCGEKLHYTTEVWNCYSEQLGRKEQIIGLTTFEELLEKADLITIDGSPYLHTWDYEDDYLISTIYEEDGLIYATNIDKLEIFAIYKEGNVYKIVCEDTDYKVTLHTLGDL